MGRLLVIVFLSLMVAQSHADAPAQVQEPVGIQQEIYSLWNRLKVKVQTIWASWTDEKTEATTTDTRTPASEAPTTQEPQTSLPTGQPNPSNPVVTENLDRTPHFVAPVKGTGKQEMHQAAEAVKAQNYFQVSKPARAPTTEIAKDKFGVPVLELEKQVVKKEKKGKKVVSKTETVRVVTAIPRLDIGEEASISSNEFALPDIQILRVDYKKYAELNSPLVMSAKDLEKSMGAAVVHPGEPIKIKRAGDADDIGVVTLKKVQDVAYKVAEDSAIDIKAIKEMDEEDLRFIRGLMLYVAGDKCHYASGIFYDSRSSKKDSLKEASRFYLGDCLYKMGLFSQAAENLFPVLGSNLPGELKTKAYAALTDFPEDYNIELGQKFEKYFDAGITVKPEQKQKAAYMISAAAMRKENFNTAKKYGELVEDSHPNYVRAQFIVAISEYNLGRAKTGLDRLKKLQTILPREPVHKDLHALISLNLARMAFQEKQFAEASKYYLAIEKNHPLWITGLTEHAWTQLMAGDNEGAIGNMFSLQSTYLKAVYRPESYIVRTIGYLNLCQYADAYKSLSLLEREYRPWLPRIEAFKRNNLKPIQYYQTMIKYLTSSSSAEVGGLPYQALREIGRHKDFLNIQEDINLKIDEGEQYKFIDGIAAKDFDRSKNLRSQAMARLKTLESDIQLLAKGKKVNKDENQLKMLRANERNTIEFYDFLLSVYREAGSGVKKMRETGRAHLASEREVLATRAGEILRRRLELIQRDLNKYFENNEFLRYEVFAGSGENIRFYMAGGDSKAKRLPPSAKPENKELNWDFQGEFWEDEIGHYKTTLKDNCPQKAAAK